MGYFLLRLAGKICPLNLFTGEVVKVLLGILDQSKPLFPFTHIDVGHPLSKACVPFEHYQRPHGVLLQPTSCLRCTQCGTPLPQGMEYIANFPYHSH